ncbi:MAG: sigma-E factor negative regulatory protein [Gammaproteobacteria bacterium]
MSRMTEEQLSVWLDDELEEGESEMLVRRLSTHPELRRTAARYLLMGDAARGELATDDPLQVSKRLSVALDGESTSVAAAPAVMAGWRRPLAGAAVAASVAVVAILGLRSNGVEPTPGAPISAETSPVPEYTVPVPLSRRAGSPDRLSAYYLNHSEYATSLSRQGSLARMISAPAENPAVSEEDPDEDATERDADKQ